MKIQKTYIKNLLVAFHKKDYNKVYLYLDFLSRRYVMHDLNMEIEKHKNAIENMLKAGFKHNDLLVLGMQDSMIELMKKRGDFIKC